MCRLPLAMLLLLIAPCLADQPPSLRGDADPAYLELPWIRVESQDQVAPPLVVPRHPGAAQFPSAHPLWGPRDIFYCQDPEYSMVYQMSSGFDAEIADDIPSELAGQVIGEITLWIGEWDAPWQDPLGVRVNFYHEACPPTMEPTISFTIPWSEWSTELVYDGLAEVYRATAMLPEPVAITAGMSLGVTALIDWGTASPFTGFCATPMYVSYGACVAYLDAANWGYSRWTAIDFYTTIAQDLAYCLGGIVTATPDPPLPLSNLPLTVRPNPFNPQTALKFSLAAPCYARLRIFDLTGRCVDVLLAESLEAGEHEVTWQGRDRTGQEVSSGIYCAQLEAKTGSQTTVSRARLLLVR